MNVMQFIKYANKFQNVSVCYVNYLVKRYLGKHIR